MPIRVECTTEGLEECWIEVDDAWSRRELREYTKLKGDPFVELWRRKVTACHLQTATGEVITEPVQVHERLDDLDMRLLGFVGQAPLEVTGHLLVLGEVNKRLSLPGADPAAKTTKAPTAR